MLINTVETLELYISVGASVYLLSLGLFQIKSLKKYFDFVVHQQLVGNVPLRRSRGEVSVCIIQFTSVSNLPSISEALVSLRQTE